MPKPLIVVTGKNGQLGWELLQLSGRFAGAFDFLFAGREDMDMSEPETIPVFFENIKPDYVINCAAYTAVDKAETDQETAYTVNATAAGMIAKECHRYGCVYLGISTDYVFNGKGTAPYTTSTACDPVNYYGYTKYMGEQLALEHCEQSVIIRTSWVYSSHGHNFVKTMLRLMKERPEIKVVHDQIGSPTYAADLAEVLMQVIESMQHGHAHYGIYHYSNAGAISWYDFALAIKAAAGMQCEVLPIPTAAYPTPAKRPAYSVLDTTAIQADYGIVLKDWKQQLHTCLSHNTINPLN